MLDEKILMVVYEINKSPTKITIRENLSFILETKEKKKKEIILEKKIFL